MMVDDYGAPSPGRTVWSVDYAMLHEALAAAITQTGAVFTPESVSLERDLMYRRIHVVARGYTLVRGTPYYQVKAKVETSFGDHQIYDQARWDAVVFLRDRFAEALAANQMIPKETVQGAISEMPKPEVNPRMRMRTARKNAT